MDINNVIICGLGALGLTYANKLHKVCELRVLADLERVEKYRKTPPKFNGKVLSLDYLLPNDFFSADLVIISTKSTGLSSAIDYIKNFVSPNTIIISLINGISSEEEIKKAYPEANVLKSYFIGHSAMRNGLDVSQDGIGKIVIEPNFYLERFFQNKSIEYEVSTNILYSQWLKLGVNIVLNQLSAIYRCTVGELRTRKDFEKESLQLLQEVKAIAEVCNVARLENYEKEVFEAIKLIADDGKTSMYQDVLARKKTEVDIFSGEIIRLGKIYNISTPYNEKIYSKIKEMEREF
ncbi:MAG: ketopantoate reductase family protein [Cyanobacteria bacterium SIG31]|nr:ketopantoate reductase family protein [Cyanobacteria bacterium SIG31]